jgi:arabinan endo-1,5-alpha-L-arabinosidase
MYIFALALLLCAADGAAPGLKLEQITIRDPFVLPVPEEQAYYLYGTIPAKEKKGFFAYRSKDLRLWEGPVQVFQAPADFWGTKNFWAPEVHRYKGRYYLFGTCAKENPLFRGTQVFVSDSPGGPFTPLGTRAQTPADWLSLDGTLFVDEDQKPWMLFCHEWLQVGDGEICAMRLSEDLSRPEGEPVLLFHATDTPEVHGTTGTAKKGFVTDGPWLHRTSSGKLLMLWSSFGRSGKYTTFVARSQSGKITGPWIQEAKPLFQEDGGHAMLFRTLDGTLMLSLHQPNSKPSRPRFFPVEETVDYLKLKGW